MISRHHRRSLRSATGGDSEHDPGRLPFSLGRLDSQLEELDRKLGAMCSKLDSMNVKVEAA